MERDLVKRIHWTPQLVNKFWDGVAQTELDNLSFGKVAGPKFLELIENYLVPGGHHLDFGAGSGHVLQLLLDKGLNSAGFDPSPDRQALLLDKIGQHKNFLGVKGVDSKEQFDVVLLMEVVEHVLDEDFDKVLERVARFVKSGGYLIVSTPNNENLETSSVYCPISDTFFHPWQHVRSFTPSQLSDCFKKLGFSTEFVALADFSCDVEFIEAYKDSFILKERLELSAVKYQQLHDELERIDAFFLCRGPFGLWQKIKRRFNLLFRHRSLIGSLYLTSQNMAHLFNEVLGQMEQPSDTSKSTQAVDGIDLRIGKETTIVYVGKKL